MRRSVLVRLVALSLAVTFSAILATAWLAALTLSTGLQQDRSSSLADDSQIYRTLVEYAATHTSWDKVQPVLASLADSTGRDIALRYDGAYSLSSESIEPARIPADPIAIVNPLEMDPVIAPDSPPTGISPLVAGAYVLAEAEKEQLTTLAENVVSCIAAKQGASTVETRANGRPVVIASPVELGPECGTDDLNARVTETEYVELQELGALTSTCLQDRGIAAVALTRSNEEPTGFGWTPAAATSDADAPAIDSCIVSSRKQELSGWVAPPAGLYVFENEAPPAAGFSLSKRNVARIAAVSAAILALAVVATVLVGRRVTRPVRELTAAAQRITDGDAGVRVPVHGDDEIAGLARSFNTMSADRERMEEQRSALTSDIAHELRTPLTNIRGWIEARQDGLAADEAQFTSSLLEEALQLQRIVDDLQDLTHADAGTLRLHRQSIDAVEFFAALAASHLQQARLKGVTLEAIAEPIDIDADPVRLRQILDNLIANALNHTPKDGTVVVTATREGDANVLRVADTGSGLSADEISHVFDRFWRADASRSRTTGGSGLGLTIAHRLAQAHGGSIEVSSTVGVGSTFAVRLPI